MILAKSLSLTLILFGQAAPMVDITLPPANAITVATAEGRGVQIYRCLPQSGGLQWVFEAPEATLFQPGSAQQLGTHAAGPTWTWMDGSTISGKVVAKQPSPVANAIPWLLLQTHAAASPSGQLSTVTLVRRSNTQAGSPPQTACDASAAGTTLRVPYQATYTFYSTPAAAAAQ
ncbi:MAG: DUF3455 domain-containing protein [Janthinobacterium lividum]